MYLGSFSASIYVGKWGKQDGVEVNWAADTTKVSADLPGRSELLLHPDIRRLGCPLESWPLIGWSLLPEWGQDLKAVGFLWILENLGQGSSWGLSANNIPGSWDNEWNVLNIEPGMMDHSACYRVENTGKTCKSLGWVTSWAHLVFHMPGSLSVALLNLIWSQEFSQFWDLSSTLSLELFF